MLDVRFSKPEIVVHQPRIEIFRRHLVWLIETDILKKTDIPSLKPVVGAYLWRYLVSSARYSDLLVENREIFIPHLY